MHVVEVLRLTTVHHQFYVVHLVHPFAMTRQLIPHGMGST
jgi:hypothetical protein